MYVELCQEVRHRITGISVKFT